MNMLPTYAFDNGKVYAYLNGQIIASASDIDQLEAKLAEKSKGDDDDLPHGNSDTHGEIHDREPQESSPQRDDTSKGQYTEEVPDDQAHYQDDPDAEEEDEDEDKKLTSKVTHVETPNGLKGKILGRYNGTWGPEVSIRLENGRITSLPVSNELKFSSDKPKPPANPLEHLNQVVARVTPGDRSSLIERRSELMDAKREAQDLVRQGAPYQTEQKLDAIVAQASQELFEIREALDYIDSQRIEDPEQWNSKAATQVDFGHRSNSTWLDSTIEAMHHEAENTDYEKLMEEGPTIFVVELNDGIINDPKVTRELASSFIRTRTAGANVPERETFEKIFLDRVESARKEEANKRTNQQKQAQQKQATAEDFDGPAEGLFF